MEMIERIAGALKLAPYRLFMDEPGSAYGEPDKTADFLAGIPPDIRKDIISRLSTAICASVTTVLAP